MIGELGEVKTVPGWFDWMGMEWKTNGFMVLFSDMNREKQIYPVICASRAGGIEGAAGRSRPSWGSQAAWAGLRKGADLDVDGGAG